MCIPGTYYLMYWTGRHGELLVCTTGTRTMWCIYSAIRQMLASIFWTEYHSAALEQLGKMHAVCYTCVSHICHITYILHVDAQNAAVLSYHSLAYFFSLKSNLKVEIST